MKKMLLLVFGFIAISVNAQTISFYTNAGLKKVTTLKYGDFSNLIVKIKLPETWQNYDDVRAIVALSSGPYGSLSVKNATVSNDTVIAWILGPGVGGKGDFGLDSSNIFTKSLKYHYKRITITVTLKGYKIVGSRSYWVGDELRTEPTYDNGVTLDKSSIVMTDIPLLTTYNLSDGLITGTYAKPEIGFSGVYSSHANISYVDDNYSTVVSIAYMSKSDIENDKTYQEMKKKDTQLDPYQYVKNDLVAWIGRYNKNVNFKNQPIGFTIDPFLLLAELLFPTKNYFYLAPIYDWDLIFDIKGDYCHTDFDITESKQKIKPSYYTNPNLWTQQKLGNYNFDYIHLDNFDVVKNYSDETGDREMGEKGTLNLYTVDVGDNIFIIFMMDGTADNSFCFNDKFYDQEMKLVSETLEKIKFSSK